MVGEIHDGGLIRGGGIVNAKFAGPIERIHNFTREVSGIPLISVATPVTKHQRRRVLGQARLAVPANAIETTDAAMKMMRAIVAGEDMITAAKAKSAQGNAVAEATDNGAEIGMSPEIGIEGIEAQDDIFYPPVSIGDSKRANDASVVDDLDLEALAVRKGEEFDGLSFVRAAVWRGWNGGCLARPCAHDGPNRMGPKAADPGDDPEKTRGWWPLRAS